MNISNHAWKIICSFAEIKKIKIRIPAGRMLSKKRLTIVIDAAIPFMKGALDDYANIFYLPADEIDLNRVSKADALVIRTRTKITEALIRFSKLRLIASATIGHDHIDFEACKKQGITVVTAPGCNAASVAQYMASAFARIFQNFSRPFDKTTLGVVGVGHVGTKVAELGRRLGMRVLLCDPPRARMEGPGSFYDYQEVLQNSDILTFHVPLTYQGSDPTYHMLHQNNIEQIKPGSWIINTSRGAVIDTEALRQRTNDLHYVIDVWEHEPYPDAKLMAAAEIATPHIAGYSLDGKAMGTQMAVQAVSRFFHLDRNEWTAPVPEPANFRLQYYPEKSITENLLRLFQEIYDIEHESGELKAGPEKFEWFRSHYPRRWEAPHYVVLMPQDKTAEKNFIEQFGFQTDAI